MLGNNDYSYSARFVRCILANDSISQLYLNQQALEKPESIKLDEDLLGALGLSNQTEFFVRYFQLFFQKERSDDEIKLAAAKISNEAAIPFDLATSDLMRLINLLTDEHIYHVLESNNGKILKKTSPEKFFEVFERIQDESCILRFLALDYGEILAEKSPEKFVKALEKIKNEHYISGVLLFGSGRILAEKLIDEFVKALEKIKNEPDVTEVLSSNSGKILAEKLPEEFAEAFKKIKEQSLVLGVESSEAWKIFLSKKPENQPENPRAEKADGKTTTEQRSLN